MPISKHGIYENPTKSPYSYETWQSDMERRMMARLEADAEVIKWQKRHGISIRWIDANGRQSNYRPDFLVEYADGRKAIIEVKDPSKLDSQAIQRKRRAAEEWCRKRGMNYELATIPS